MASEVNLRLKCRLYWRLVEEYDNSNNKNSTINRTVVISKYKAVNGQEYARNIQEHSTQQARKDNVKVEAGMKWVPVSVSVDYKASKSLEDFVSSTTEIYCEETVKEETVVKSDCSIGPGDKLYFYQQTFSGAGMDFDMDATAVVSTKKTAEDDKDIYIVVVARPVEFIKNIDVVYGGRPSDAPNDRVRESSGWNDDMNYQMKGDYVWLVPKYTFNADEACTSFEFRLQKDRAEGGKDLASGAGGEYRYLVPIRDRREMKKIKKLALIRQNNFDGPTTLTARLGKHWAGANFDINKNRGGTWLWFAWEQY
ncbi:hypothetical protein F5Y09DRAFT_345596 [Xylaria sp. FL1042]|nr:hypothetical protein F5Y09DRAFT_345596 [Xylaria sp. FL1042]